MRLCRRRFNVVLPQYNAWRQLGGRTGNRRYSADFQFTTTNDLWLEYPLANFERMERSLAPNAPVMQSVRLRSLIRLVLLISFASRFAPVVARRRQESRNAQRRRTRCSTRTQKTLLERPTIMSMLIRLFASILAFLFLLSFLLQAAGAKNFAAVRALFDVNDSNDSNRSISEREMLNKIVHSVSCCVCVCVFRLGNCRLSTDGNHAQCNPILFQLLRLFN